MAEKLTKYKITFKKQRIATDEKIVFIEAKTNKEVEEYLKSISMDELIKKYGSVDVEKGKVTETDWKSSVSKV